MRLEIRLAIVTLVAGIAAAVLAGRRATEEPVEDNEPMQGTQSAQMALDAGDQATDAAEARTQYELALSHAESAITEDGRNPLAHRLAAMASMGTDDYVSADAHFDRAAELRPLYDFD